MHAIVFNRGKREQIAIVLLELTYFY